MFYFHYVLDFLEGQSATVTPFPQKTAFRDYLLPHKQTTLQSFIPLPAKGTEENVISSLRQRDPSGCKKNTLSGVCS